RDRSDIEQAAAISDQLAGKSQRQVGQRAHVDVDDAELLGAVEFGRGAEQAEARIVDKVFDLGAGLGQRGSDPVAGIRRLKIAGDQYRRVPAGGGDLARERGQTI